MTHDNPGNDAPRESHRYVNLSGIPEMVIDPRRAPTIEESLLLKLRSRDLCDFELTRPEMRAVRRLRKKGLVLRSMKRDNEFGWSWRKSDVRAR